MALVVSIDDLILENGSPIYPNISMTKVIGYVAIPGQPQKHQHRHGATINQATYSCYPIPETAEPANEL